MNHKWGLQSQLGNNLAINTHIKQPNEIRFALETSTLVFIKCFVEVQILINYSCLQQCRKKVMFYNKSVVVARSSDGNSITYNWIAQVFRFPSQNRYFHVVFMILHNIRQEKYFTTNSQLRRMLYRNYDDYPKVTQSVASMESGSDKNSCP